MENFMSILGPIFLDINPITLFYGPNSAGKSAVYSAIKLIGQLGNARQNHVAIEEAAVNNTHRLDYDRHIRLGVRARIYDFTWPLIEEENQILNISFQKFCEEFSELSSFFSRVKPDCMEFEAHFTVAAVSSVDKKNNRRHAFVSVDEIKERGKTLVEINYCDGTIFHLDHPVMIAVEEQLAQEGLSFLKLLSVLHPIETHTINGNVLETSLQIIPERGALVYWEEQTDYGALGKTKEHHILDVLLRIIIILPLHHLFLLCNEFCHIGPLRHVPSDRQLTFLLNHRGSTDYDAYSSMEKTVLSWSDGTLAWKKLAENRSLSRCYGNFGEQEIALIDAVNSWLCSDQRIGMSHRLFASQAEIKQPPKHKGKRVSELRIARSRASLPDRIIQIELEDLNLGITVSVSNVGTGVPQLVPVIVAGLTEANVFIEQPELHLHPKLQTEVADFFLSCWNKGGATFLVESHSEYLALRILRRVRETQRADIRHVDYSVTQDDIAFYYFDISNGVTEIKRLRVSSDGEFLDRWPKGFFAEREAELFDEDD